jgi:endonuclease YncB( thermonuclease family)
VRRVPPVKAGSRSSRHSRWVGADVHACELVLLAVVLFAVSALGESIEKWKTPSGTLYFRNRPPAGSTLLGIEANDERPATDADVSTEPARTTSSMSRSEHLGKVVEIADSDTFTLLVGHEQYRIRLAEIDTPEGGQPYGSRARQALSELIYGNTVRVVEIDQDRYGRIVGRVYVGNLDVNAEMVRRGAAWVYRKYARDPSLYDLENEAR